MYGKHFIFYVTMNQSGGVASEKVILDSREKAEDKFYDLLSTVGGNPQTKLMSIEWRDENFGLVDSITRNKSENEPIEE